MSREISSPLALTLLILMRRQGWNQNEIAAALGVTPGTVSGWVRKGEGLDRERLEQIVVQVLKLDSGEIERTLRFLAGDEAGDAVDAPLRLDGLTPRERRSVERARSDLLKAMGQIAEAGSARLAGPGRLRKARAQAEACWQRLQQVPPEMRTSLINRVRAYRTPAFCARICAESRHAASSSASRALTLAKLALYVAQRVPGDVSLRCQAYAWAFIANAHRVAGKLPRADVDFAQALALWESGKTEDPFISEVNFLDLEASLRCDQRRSEEAFRLLDKALTLVAPRRKGNILLNQAHVHYVCGQFIEAVETLRQAELLIDREQEPRSWFALQFNLSSCFCKIGNFQEAEKLFKDVCELGLRLDQNLDLLRLRWLGARVRAGLEEGEEAAQVFQDLRTEYRNQKNPFDSALVSLDLAELYLRRARWLEVLTLAEAMILDFQKLGVHQEAQAALLLFRKAVQQRQVSIDFVRRLARYLENARRDSSYHFSG